MPLLAAETLLEWLRDGHHHHWDSNHSHMKNKSHDITKGELSAESQERRLRNYDPAKQPCKQGNYLHNTQLPLQHFGLFHNSSVVGTSLNSVINTNMATKSLSTSTLSLRFMQNANRAKQMKEVELDRAEVKDDGKWEVSQVVRDSWGLSRDNSEWAYSRPLDHSALSSWGRSVDVHEESYLPFLFADKSGDDKDIDGFFKKAAGRRIFNKKGEEVSTKVCSRYFSWVFSLKVQIFLGARTGTTGCICIIFIQHGTAYDWT